MRGYALGECHNAHLLSVCRMAAIKVWDEIVEESSLDDYDKVVFI